MKSCYADNSRKDNKIRQRPKERLHQRASVDLNVRRGTVAIGHGQRLGFYNEPIIRPYGNQGVNE